MTWPDTLYHLSFFIAGILISPSSFFLVFILIKNGKNRLHKIWAIFNLFVGIWGIGCVLMGLSQEYESSLLAAKIGFSFGFLIAPIFYHTTRIYLHKKANFFVIIGYLLLGINSLLQFPLLGKENFGVPVPTFGDFFFIRSASYYYSSMLLLWDFYAFLGNWELYHAYRASSGEEKLKIAYFFIPMAIGFTGGAMNTLPMLGIHIFPYGNFTIPAYCWIVTYAFLKHNITDINLALKKGLVYSIQTILILIFFLSLILIFEKYIQGVIGYKSLTLSLIFSITIALCFIPLKQKIEYLINKVIFKGSLEELAIQNELLLQEVSRSDKFKSMATLASGMAHEIKNPLTVIKTFTEYFPDRKSDQKFMSKFCRLVSKEVDKIDGLVHQLLEFAKPTPLDLKEVKVHPLINNTLDFLNNEFLKKKVKVIKKFVSSDNLMLKADPNQLRQALLNIFLNAIEAMDKGGTLTIIARIKGIEDQRGKESEDDGIKGSKNYQMVGKNDKNNPPNPLILKSLKPSLEIIISDTGCGIEKDDLPHIFDPFFTKKGGGTSLGLSITHGIIKEHGGRIRVESVKKQGAAFILELPLKS